jgi:hypothetical protein
MASAAAEQAVRAYLGALKDPSSLRDDERIAKLERELERSNDQLERVLLQQQLLDAKSPSVEQFEEAFIEHARSWAEEHGVSPSAFQSEGVPSTVLRRAGFQVRGGRARGRAARRRSAGRRTRVSADEVRKAIPEYTEIPAKVAEEIAYRGVLVALAAAVTGSLPAAVIASALAFAAVHAPQGFAGVGYVFVIALLHQALVFISGTLLLAIVVHFMYDVLAGLWLARKHGLTSAAC